jgi:hypothetical protein
MFFYKKHNSLFESITANFKIAWRKCYAILFLLLLTINGLTAQTDPIPQSAIKAAFLFNFTGFIEWPSIAFKDADQPLVIGILGDNPFGSYLSDIILNENKNGHPLKIKYFTKAEDVSNCHILFITKRKQEQLIKVLALLKDSSILTVGDDPDFIKYGGIVRFFTEGNKVKFQINADAAKEINLILSSKLLRLAQVSNNPIP